MSVNYAAHTLASGERLQSGLFGVVYVLDEPSAGLHPADTEALLGVLDRLKEAGNTVFVVEHQLDVVRHADWLVDVGPLAGEHGGRVLHSGPPQALAGVGQSATARHLFAAREPAAAPRPVREATGEVRLSGVDRNNLRDLEARFPLGVFTAVTGVSGSGKSTLVGQVLAREVGERLAEPDFPERRLVEVDQKPIGRTPRSNLATYTGLFDVVRRLFTAAPEARARGWKAQRIKLATELQRLRRDPTLYLLDEPTTGLHPADVRVLLRQLHGLVDAGHSVVVVEHDMDVVAGADWVIDLGPGGGAQGGLIVAEGTPWEVARTPGSRTADYLARALDTVTVDVAGAGAGGTASA